MNGGHASIQRKEVKRATARKYRFGAIISAITQRLEILEFEVVNYPVDDELNEIRGLTKYVSGIWDFFQL